MLRRFGTAGVTFALAFGSAYLLQNGGLNPKPVRQEPISNVTITPLTAEITAGDASTPMALRPIALPELPRAGTALPEPGAALAQRIAAIDPNWRRPEGASLARYDDFGQTCPTTRLSLTPTGDGLMTVLFSNPCDAGAHLVMQHDGITVEMTADTEGRAVLSFPILNRSGRITLQSDSGETLALTRVFDGQYPPRIVIRSDMAGALSLGSGTAVALGDKGNPIGWTDTLQGEPQPILRAKVTPQTCGHDLTARVTVTGATPRSDDITLSMPECSAIGQSVLYPLTSDERYAAGN